MLCDVVSNRVDRDCHNLGWSIRMTDLYGRGTTYDGIISVKLLIEHMMAMYPLLHSCFQLKVSHVDVVVAR